MGGTPALAFQPAVDLATGGLLGFEALLRWPDSAGKIIPPEDLVVWAEIHGHLAALNGWVVEEACAQAARWPSKLQVSVNCSLFQLGVNEAAQAAITGLRHAHLRPDRLSIEITETSVATGPVADGLCAMARVGIQVSVDDTVSPRSISPHLRDCAVNTVKIDAPLIRWIAEPQSRSRAIVETIIRMSHSLGISTVAEAVERQEQVMVLRELGADAAQGYFFSPPLDAASAHELAAMSPPPRFDLTRQAARWSSLDPFACWSLDTLNLN